ncbi:MAG: ornithine carbamoyltransferase [Methanocorpusculum sp.]|jgi:ornithine carbamoyltransferase|uniref:Ornithine carbamoyltransferase n=1 Tax=Methanocorpusculum parvum TaxID=2193 RepID=A0AAX0Q6W6_9EURY|nr:MULTISPECIES: ornithine carbamoyltransferase [Methanocorpusculum]MDD2248840.1 ornithine carbamoyltransferase [Methanocorpusculum sp.]MDD3047245.1 ornithine carbamoyltransferase [Methanocorpusculum sp.]MDD3912430.1 ornithine carbamoyltransferase [Methanocorpusculum sp.]MDD4423557.1 ornithine carbamoyltransferase [Methanocorpusculum parvum]PAV08890.1 ornithine carbamoyltransferase [Methanocorpusculum parvum]
MKKDFLSITDLSAEEYEDILTLAARLKRQRYAGVPHPLLAGKTLAMIFEKASTRTRMSFDVGMYDLGGYALYLNAKETQLGRGETVADTARVMSRYVHGAIMRTYKHETITEFAKYASIPVINALSDKEHPCQIMADSLTLKEKFGDLDGLKIAWIGDGNNVCNSLIMASVQTGMEIAVGTPKGYEPDPAAVKFAKENGGKVTVYDDPVRAVTDAHAIYTDTWISMGEEDIKESKLKDFVGYQLDTALLNKAASDALVLHCLPAHRGEEITDEVIDSMQSGVWDQAENRLHAQKAILVRLMSLGH